MGIILRTKNTNFESTALSFLPPVSDGLEYWGYYPSAERAARNMAPGKPNAVVVGAPVYGAGFATLSGSAYVQTSVPDLPNMTLVSVFRAATDVRSVLIASGPTASRAAPFSGASWGSSLYSDGGASGDGLLVVKANRSHFDGGSGTTAAVTAERSISASSSWRAFAGVYDGALKRVSLSDLATGSPAVALATPPNDVVDLSAVTYRIGSAYGAGLGVAATDIAFSAIYSRPLSEQELADVYGHAQGYLLDRFGLVV